MRAPRAGCVFRSCESTACPWPPSISWRRTGGFTRCGQTSTRQFPPISHRAPICRRKSSAPFSLARRSTSTTWAPATTTTSLVGPVALTSSGGCASSGPACTAPCSTRWRLGFSKRSADSAARELPRERHRGTRLPRSGADGGARGPRVTSPRTHGAGASVRVDVQGGVLAGIGSGVVNGRSGDAVLMADVDLTNLDELPGVPDGTSLAQCLERFHAQDSVNFVGQLRGAFSIALWIPSRRRLVLVADRLGFRRLYYAVSDQGLAFGSRVKAPLALPGLSQELDADAVYAYLNFGTVPAPQSIYRAVRRLAPGQILVWENGRVSLHQYWDVVYSERRLDKAEAARAIYGQTAEAVRQTLTGLEVKDTGAFLSGGTDSSAVVGLMSRLTGERVQAFSIGFQEERYNELEYAELAARHFDAAHYSRIITA